MTVKKGTIGNDIIFGTNAKDVLFGLNGHDILLGGADDDILIGGNGNDTLDGGSGNDALYGGNDNDTLYGGAGDDLLSGGTGSDTMYGGAGDDSYYIDTFTDKVYEQADEGIDTVYTTLEWTGLGANIENLTYVGEYGENWFDPIYLFGNDLDNVITGGERSDYIFGGDGDDTLIGGGGVDVLFGGAGNDFLDGGYTMHGGTGDDTYQVDTNYHVVTEAAGEGVDTVFYSGTYLYTLTENVENLILSPDSGGGDGSGNALDNTITGNSADNELRGEGGNDTISGGAGDDKLSGGSGDDVLFGGDGNDKLLGDGGDDIMNGGSGNDYYSVDSAGDQIIGEDAGAEDIDTVQVSNFSSYTLADELENLEFRIGAALPDGADHFEGIGNAKDNIMTAGWSDTVLYGLGGDDTLNGDYCDDTLYGGDGNDTLYGDGGNDILWGGAGNDRLDGGAKADQMIGGTGNDTYVVNDAGDVIVEAAGEGIDTVESSIDYQLGSSLENLTLTGGSGMKGTGNNLDNTITGAAGDDMLFGLGGSDVLTGGTGNDIMSGGTGDDAYHVDSLLDVVIEAAGAGTDTVFYSGTEVYTLAENVENLILSPASGGGHGEGNALDNIITGNAADNFLFGNDGNDWLRGQGGDDQISGDNGNDLIDGGSGADMLTGGAGGDFFYYEFVSDSPDADGQRDFILDFVSGEDKIVLAAMDANGSTESNEAFTFIGGTSFSGTAGELQVTYSDAMTAQVRGDVDGDGVADFAIDVAYTTPLEVHDFIL